MGISDAENPVGASWCELRLAKIKPESDGWSNLCSAGPEQLKAASGIDLFEVLRTETGVFAIGTKEDVLNRTDKTRGRLCMTFPKGDQLSPLVAFVATRIMPLENAETKSPVVIQTAD
ncbi:hypothetical protein [Ruegeria lacuscaerulensis]|uniref:hypothetical protein n=1 Tax=Ruegeria lacuscaerulensis TaxID=55218 RepID=UPI00147AFF02|nr:hypothetical protein [Ruegeria lacuscaerulensis]